MHRRERSNLGRARVQQYAAGTEMAEGEYQPGDFILTSNKTLFGWLIRLGQRLVYWGRNRPYAHWSHAAMITSGKGDLIEALVTGVERTHISKYKDVEYHVVRLDPDFLRPGDREQIVRFAGWCADQDVKYGWVTVVSIGISLLTGLRFSFGFDGQQICSGLVARALERSDHIFERSPAHILPADLAFLFDIKP